MNGIAPTVFVVDDDEDVRESLTLSLKTSGLNVESYGSGQAFMDSYRPYRPGCLVLDVRMPGLNGLELQQELKKKGVKMPIVFISGHGDIPMSVRAIKAGAVDFLEKPFDKEVLLDRIREALEHDRHRREQESERERVAERFARLTARERQVLELLVSGRADKSNKEIAAALKISHRTVDKHRARVMEKMQARSLADLVTMTKSSELN